MERQRRERNLPTSSTYGGVRLRQGHASRRSSQLTFDTKYLHSRHGVITAGVQADTLKAAQPPSPVTRP
jgi:hypothetical protein